MTDMIPQLLEAFDIHREVLTPSFAVGDEYGLPEQDLEGRMLDV